MSTPRRYRTDRAPSAPTNAPELAAPRDATTREIASLVFDLKARIPLTASQRAEMIDLIVAVDGDDPKRYASESDVYLSGMFLGLLKRVDARQAPKSGAKIGHTPKQGATISTPHTGGVTVGDVPKQGAVVPDRRGGAEISYDDSAPSPAEDLRRSHAAMLDRLQDPEGAAARSRADAIADAVVAILNAPPIPTTGPAAIRAATAAMIDRSTDPAGAAARAEITAIASAIVRRMKGQ